jgi:hypothetical protein
MSAECARAGGLVGERGGLLGLESREPVEGLFRLAVSNGDKERAGMEGRLLGNSVGDVGLEGAADRFRGSDSCGCRVVTCW